MAWISTAEALAALNVRAQTLYANVSRGKIRAKPDPADSRRSLYHREDVLRMARRSNGRRKVETVAAQAIEWGDPLLSSAISTVVDGQLWYRGRNAIELAKTASFEEIACLLWESEAMPIATAAGSVPRDLPPIFNDPLQAGLMALARRSATDLPSHGRSVAVLRKEAASVLATLADAIFGDSALEGECTVIGSTISERAAAAWRCGSASDCIRRALVLLADHELNTSTFATRVTISTGASLSAGVLAGLTTLTGPLHGGASESVGALIECAQKEGAQAALRKWLALGRAFAGFGHPLYPDGDPRATALLDVLEVPALHRQLASLIEDATGERPNVDFALAVLTSTLGLPSRTSLALFALGRCAGWLAHALEQVETGRLIRPRARYIGAKPGAGDVKVDMR